MGVDDGTYVPLNKNYAEAQAFCKEKAEGSLAVANDEATRNFLANYQDYDVRRGSWIGGKSTGGNPSGLPKT